MKKILVSLVVMLFFSVPMTFSFPIEQDATANGEFATFVSVGGNIADNTDQEDFVNGLWGPGFFHIGKYEKDTGMATIPGWEMSVTFFDDPITLLVDGNNYNYNYQYEVKALTGSGYEGATIDFVLGVKQATSFIAYFFETITLDITGTFNSYGNIANLSPDYSHISGMVRGTQQVPEPTTLLLFGAGIAGLAMYRRKRS